MSLIRRLHNIIANKLSTCSSTTYMYIEISSQLDRIYTCYYIDPQGSAGYYTLDKGIYSDLLMYANNIQHLTIRYNTIKHVDCKLTHFGKWNDSYYK